MIKMPILLEGHTLTPRTTLHPVSLQIQLREQPLSTSTMQLTKDDADVPVSSWVLITTPQGEKQVHIVRIVQTDINTGMRSISCEHIWSTAKDMLVRGNFTPDMMGGSATEVEPAIAIRELLSWHNDAIWTLGDCDFDEPQGWTINNSSIFDAVNTMMGTMLDAVLAFDLSSIPFVFHIRRKSNAVACEMRSNRNLSTMRVSEDRNGMATRIYPSGADDLTISDNDHEPYVERNTEQYGVISRVLQEPSITDKEKLRAWATKMLERTAVPQVSISISGLELSQATGEPLDRLTVGTVCRVPLPDDGIVIEQRITDISWANALTDPMAVTITLANNRDTVQGVLRKINQNNTQLKNGLAGAKKLAGDAMTKSDKRWTEFQQTMTAIRSGAYWIDNNVTYMTELIQTANSLEGVAAQYNYDDSGDLLGAMASKFVFKAGNVSLNLTSTDFSGQQVMGAINAYIEGDKSHLKMDFDAIEFDGHVDFVDDATFGKGIEANVVRTPPDGGMETGTMEVLDSFTSPSITDRANEDGTGLMLSNIISMSLNVNCSGVADLKIGKYGSLGSDKELGRLFGDNDVSFNAADVPHYHTFTENSDGTITIGGVSSTPGNFKISATRKYIEDVAAALSEGWTAGGQSAYVGMHKLTSSETPAKTPTDLLPGGIYQFYPMYKTQNGGNTSAPADVLDANSKWVAVPAGASDDEAVWNAAGSSATIEYYKVTMSQTGGNQPVELLPDTIYQFTPQYREYGTEPGEDYWVGLLDQSVYIKTPTGGNAVGAKINVQTADGYTSLTQDMLASASGVFALPAGGLYYEIKVEGNDGSIVDKAYVSTPTLSGEDNEMIWNMGYGVGEADGQQKSSARVDEREVGDISGPIYNLQSYPNRNANYQLIKTYNGKDVVQIGKVVVEASGGGNTNDRYDEGYKDGGESAYVSQHKLTASETPLVTPTVLQAGATYQFYPMYKTQNGGNTSAPSNVVDANSKWVTVPEDRYDQGATDAFNQTFLQVDVNPHSYSDGYTIPLGAGNYDRYYHMYIQYGDKTREHYWLKVDAKEVVEVDNWDEGYRDGWIDGYNAACEVAAKTKLNNALTALDIYLPSGTDSYNKKTYIRTLAIANDDKTLSYPYPRWSSGVL